MDKVQKHNSFNTNTPSSESYREKSCLKTTQITVQFLIDGYTMRIFTRCTGITRRSFQNVMA